jgi:hypothetical protein
MIRSHLFSENTSRLRVAIPQGNECGDIKKLSAFSVPPQIELDSLVECTTYRSAK